MADDCRSRQWKYLDPLRAACEARGLPVSMADEEAPPLWRLRETQALLAFAEAHGALISSGILSGWLAARPANGWADSVQDALAAFAGDTQGAEVTLDYFRDWLAEWGRANRHRQTGLLLLSAHRAKGLEFDHVFVLDGEWSGQKGEDTDAARRLYYVAMTRARQTLTLARLDIGNPLIDRLPDSPTQLRRPASEWLPEPAGLDRRYIIPTLREIDLGFAGRKKAGERIHTRIAALEVGDVLQHSFHGADLSGADFTGCDMRNCNLGGANFLNAIFYGCDLKGANLAKGNFSRADFRGADLTGVDLSDADLTKADMRMGAKIISQNLVTHEKVESLEGTTIFKGADLENEDMREARAAQVDLSQSNLTNARMSNIVLSQANLENANMAHVDLTAANLENARMAGVVLTGATLTDTKMAGAYIEYVLMDKAEGKVFDYLVEHQHVGIVDERLDQTHALLVALRELAAVSRRHVGDVGLLHRLVDPAADLA